MADPRATLGRTGGAPLGKGYPMRRFAIWDVLIFIALLCLSAGLIGLFDDVAGGAALEPAALVLPATGGVFLAVALFGLERSGRPGGRGRTTRSPGSYRRGTRRDG